MGSLKDWFGGSETEQKQSSQQTASSDSQATSITKDTTPVELQALRTPFVQALASMFQGSGGRPAYTGQLAAPITGAETTALDATAGAAYDPNRGNLISSTLQGTYLPGQAGENPFMQAAIKEAQRATMTNLEETLARSIPGKFNLAGQQLGKNGSSAFDRAQGVAIRGAADAMAGIATNMSMAGYEAERQRQQQMVPVSQQEVATLSENVKTQGLPRLIEQLGFDKAFEEFSTRYASLIQALQIAAGSPIAQQGTDSQSTSHSESQGTSEGYSNSETAGGIVNAFANVLGAFNKGAAPR